MADDLLALLDGLGVARAHRRRTASAPVQGDAGLEPPWRPSSSTSGREFYRHDVTQAVFGLIGVIVGGLLTAGVQWQAARAQRSRDEKRAARILFDELSWKAPVFRWALDQDDLSAIAPPGALVAAWEATRSDLSGVRKDDWNTIHMAVRSDDTDSSDLPSPTPIPADLRAEFQRYLDRFEKASEILYRYT